MSSAAEKPLKICIRGLPADTDHRKLRTDLKEHGFDPIFMRHVARDKGPGIFCVQLQVNPKISTVYDVKKLLGVPVRVEAWRGRQGPPQCQRCQGFRHTAAECIQEYRCVHCARPHPSKNCNRPYDIPTCANCGGPHAANDLSCPAMRREEIAKAGKVLRTSGYTLSTPNLVTEKNARSSLMAVANTSWLSSQRKRRKRNAKEKRLLTSHEGLESQVEKPEAEALAVSMMKIHDPVVQEKQMLTTLSINQPQPVSKIVQEPASQDIQQVSTDQLKNKSNIPAKEVKQFVAPVNIDTAQSLAHMAQQASSNKSSRNDKSADHINKPPPVSQIVQEAFAKSITEKESKPMTHETNDKSADHINKPPPVSQIVQEAFAKSMTQKESQPMTHETKLLTSPIVKSSLDSPVQTIREVDPASKSQSPAEHTKQACVSTCKNQSKPESTTNPDHVRTKVVTECVLVLQSVLSAVQEGHNPVPIILEGLSDLCRGV